MAGAEQDKQGGRGGLCTSVAGTRIPIGVHSCGGPASSTTISRTLRTKKVSVRIFAGPQTCRSKLRRGMGRGGMWRQWGWRGGAPNSSTTSEERGKTDGHDMRFRGGEVMHTSRRRRVRSGRRRRDMARGLVEGWSPNSRRRVRSVGRQIDVVCRLGVERLCTHLVDAE